MKKIDLSISDVRHFKEEENMNARRAVINILKAAVDEYITADQIVARLSSEGIRLERKKAVRLLDDLFYSGIITQFTTGWEVPITKYAMAPERNEPDAIIVGHFLDSILDE